VSAQPIESHGAVFDPEGILNRLPERYHERFLAEYREAMVAAAHETWRFVHLQEVLSLWNRRAVMYSRPGHEERAEQARTGEGQWMGAEAVPRLASAWPGAAQ
jgi:hypothetical protein